MQKRLSYLLFFMFVFLVSFPSLKAEGEYYYYCDYNIKTVLYEDESSLLPFRAYVYENSVEVILNDSKRITADKKGGYSGIVDWPHGQGSVTSIFLGFSFNEFFARATENGKYNCPSIIATSTDVSNVSLSFGDQIDDSNIRVLTRSKTTDISKTINKNLSKELQNIILGKQQIIDKSCVHTFYNETLYNLKLGSDLKVTYYMENGIGYVELSIDSNTGRMPYPKSVGSRDTIIINYKGQDKFFTFYGNDYNKIFTQNMAQYGTNNFMCPSKAPTIDYYECLYCNNFLISYDKTILDNYGGGDSQQGVPGDGSDYEDPDDVNISSKTGVCVDYLGSAGKGDNIATLLDKIYTLIKLGSIIIVILMSSLEFANSVTKNKDDLIDVVKRFAKRLIIMIIILMLPTFIDLLGNLFGIDDILCGIK